MLSALDRNYVRELKSQGEGHRFRCAGEFEKSRYRCRNSQRTGVATSLKEEHGNSASRIFSNDRDCLAPLRVLAVCGKTGKFEVLPFRYGALCWWFSRLARHKRLFLVSLRSSLLVLSMARTRVWRSMVNRPQNGGLPASLCFADHPWKTSHDGASGHADRPSCGF